MTLKQVGGVVAGLMAVALVLIVTGAGFALQAARGMQLEIKPASRAYSGAAR